MGAKLVAITGNPQSELALLADVHLDGSVAQEACPLNLAPTASTTAALALGDALAVACLEARGFGPQTETAGAAEGEVQNQVEATRRAGDGAELYGVLLDRQDPVSHAVLSGPGGEADLETVDSEDRKSRFGCHRSGIEIHLRLRPEGACWDALAEGVGALGDIRLGHLHRGARSRRQVSCGR